MMTVCAGPHPRALLARVALQSMACLGACLITAVVLLLASGCFAQNAWAQVESREGIALQNQILELRAQLQALQNQIGRGGGSSYGGGYPPPPPSAGANDLVAQLLSRVSTLEDQVRQLRGQVDQTQNQVQRQGADLGKRIDDLSFQVQNPPGGLPPATGAVPPRPMSPQPPGLQPAPLQLQPGAPPPPGSFSGVPPPGQPPAPAGPVKRTPELAMQEGNAALARRDYATAEQAAHEVLNNYRTSPRAYDAQFLLAQALIGERQYSQAAIAYDDTYNRARKGAHAPEALLGLADSLIAINERKAACDTLTKLRMEYPTPRPEVRDEIAAASQRSGCR